MKIYRTNLLVAMILVVFCNHSCKKEGEYTLTETAPLDFKTYYNGLTVSFVNSTTNATDISWDFGDNSAGESGDSVVHTYATIGNYVITLNGTKDGSKYTFHTVLRVDKPSFVKLDDDSFADWDEVTYPDFQLEGKDHIVGGKMDYDANYVYLLVEYDTAGTNGLIPVDAGIMDLYMDVDNSLSTGFSSSMGAEVLFEGNAPTGWYDYYRFTGTDQSQWSWDYFSMDNAIVMGYSETVDGHVIMEFGLSREAFKINKDAFGFNLVLNFSDWSAEAGSLAIDNDSHIVMKMDKQ